MGIPISRIQCLNDHAARPDGDFVLYWMTAFRRSAWNFSLDRAVELAPVAESFFVLAWARAKNAKFPAALASIDRAIELEPAAE